MELLLGSYGSLPTCAFLATAVRFRQQRRANPVPRVGGLNKAKVAAARRALEAFYGDDVVEPEDLVDEEFEFVEAPECLTLSGSAAGTGSPTWSSAWVRLGRIRRASSRRARSSTWAKTWSSAVSSRSVATPAG
jgi:hypothetical protein